MTNREVAIELAERFYVIELMTLEEVAQKVGVNERTIRRWKKEYNWERKKSQFLNSKQMFHEELFSFARKLMHSIEFDINNNERVDPGRMFAFTKLLPMVIKIKAYEDDISKQNNNDEVKEITPEFIKEINEQFLGIKSDDE